MHQLGVDCVNPVHCMFDGVFLPRTGQNPVPDRGAERECCSDQINSSTRFPIPKSCSIADTERSEALPSP